jgi:squalene-hopene/tetraprenyl-beta-curcumene cyclase
MRFLCQIQLPRSVQLGLIVSLVGTGAATVLGQSAPQTAPPVHSQSAISLRHELRRAIDRGLDWLEKNQDPEGFWSTADHPAITGLALVALQGDPSGKPREKVLEKGYNYLLSCAQPDGSIYRKEELVNYNTSISMMAFLASGKQEYNPLLRNARNFIAGLQSDFGEPGKLDSPFDGGIGYGTKYSHSDMANTLQALEALYHSRHLVADQNFPGARELNWEAAIHFIQSCQNLPSHNHERWASDDPQNRGGFVYYPGHSMAGEMELPSGRMALRSYGSISYAGLLSYIYADLKPEDPRVQAVVEWLGNNFTLEENPGMGPQGLYYYFHTMAKALSLYGMDRLEVADGRKIDWRRQLALRLLDLQNADGSWENDNGRWWEKDPALVTAYAVMTLELLHQGLN